MTNPHAHRMPELIAEARAAAANPEHRWDRRALEWPLTPDSVVIEVGGFKGRWALQMAQRYHPRLYVFEPQYWAAEVCKAVLEPYGAWVLNFGLGDCDAILPMSEFETDGCSFVKRETGDGHHGEVQEIGRAFTVLGIKQIDVMLINIEGYEYTLIPHMLAKGILPKRLIVQFHTFNDPLGVQLANICERLEDIQYRLVFNYGVMLMAWERNSGTPSSA